VDQALIDKIKADMRYEIDREAPPPGFPKFHDVPGGRYISDEFYELEQEHLWTKSWVMAGRVEDIPEAGDYFVFKDLGDPLLVVRGTDGVIRCFYNTCRHRGAPVVREDQGSARRLRCQYHSWTYEIDGGTLVALPDERDFVDLDWTERSLPKVSCDSLEGFIFVNIDPDAQPLREWIGQAAEMLAPMQAESLREVYRESVLVACNWKVTAEAFLEVYHFKHIHSHDGVSVLDSDAAVMGLYPNGHSRMSTGYSRQNCDRYGMDGWDDWKELDNGPFATIDGVPDIIDCTSTAVSLCPNFITPLGKFGFPVILFWPVDRGMTRIDWIYYAPKDWEGDELPEHWETRRKQFNQIMDEDMLNMAPMQESMESAVFTGIPLNYQERRIWHLHEQIDRMIGRDNIPEELRVEQLLDPYVER
jgi:phenylpropionate dioxygenase-like ring-hydroxylating dioxygenase large terminal subunit